MVNGNFANFAANRTRIAASVKHCAPFFIREWAGVFRVPDISNAKNPSSPCLLLLPIETISARITNVGAAPLDFSFGYPENNPILINSPPAFAANIVFAQCLEKLNYKWVRGIHGEWFICCRNARLGPHRVCPLERPESQVGCKR